MLETAGWGWHSETAIHVLRMVLAGTLDKHPRLKIIIGHMGEMLPMMMARIDEVFVHDVPHLKRPISRAIRDQVWLTTSGVFDAPPFICALLTFGIDRIMFSVDYPFATNAEGAAFLERVAPAPGDTRKAHSRQRRRAVEAEGGEEIAERKFRSYARAYHLFRMGTATGSGAVCHPNAAAAATPNRSFEVRLTA